MRLGTKILLLGVLPLVIIAIAAVIILQVNRTSMSKVINEQTEKYVHKEINNLSKNIYDLCVIYNDVVQKKVEDDLAVADQLLKNEGDAVVDSSQNINWSVKNQYTEKTDKITLPGFVIGGKLAEQNPSFDVASPFVDKIGKLTGSTCTVFQRMNAAGDMLRVATNVATKEGKRAIGTFIPVTGKDGNGDQVVKTVLSGKTYYGRAFVVNAWYITAYSPLKDMEGNVIGMLYAGVQQDLGERIRQTILSTKVGVTGYIYVIGSEGDDKYHYIIADKKESDGKDLYNVQDASGKYVIRDMVDRGLVSTIGEPYIMKYPWKKADEDHARDKIASLYYFKPWGWIIGAGAYEEDFLDTRKALDAGLNSLALNLLFSIGIIAVIAVIVSIVISRGIALPIDRIIKNLRESSGQVASASNQISSASQQLAEGSTEQAASLEETSSALEEMASMTRQNADNASTANSRMMETKTQMDSGSGAVQDMSEAMDSINDSAEQISKIIKIIEEIAFQTNLLALNAAVEAARAGEAGKGFAVVADEVRNLAQRSAQAARDTATLIEDTVERVKKGTGLAKGLQESFAGIEQLSSSVANLVTEITAASQEQAQGVDQVNTAVAQMDKVTQSNAATAEETASASEELSAQADYLNQMVSELAALVNGRNTEEYSMAQASVHAPHAALQSAHKPLALPHHG